jgi:multidrug efflux pump
MWLSDISIRRPVLATVMSVIIVLLGIISFNRLPVREYPDIDPPIVSVATVYRGASPETIEATITEPLEDELTSIEGIKSMTSTSKEQLSNITIEFELSRNIDVAAQDVRDRVARARKLLPDDVDEPIIAKQEADAQAIMWLGLGGKDFTRLQLSDYADKYLKDPLQTIPGVGQVIIGGAREYAMRLWLDPVKMASRGVSQEDLELALRDKNVDIPSGRIESRFVEFNVKTRGDLYTPEMFNTLVIKTVNETPVYLRDIGRAEIGPRDDRSMVRYNGKPAVGLGIVKQSKANTLEVAHAVKNRVLLLQQQLPPGMVLEPAFDSSLFIERSIAEVQESLIVAGILVVLVILLFLQNLRSALIPAVSIPISIIGTFTFMYAMDFTINTFTLLALTLSIGLVVDDTIVVLENISRHIEMGKSAFQASIDGTREIAFAILATTITLVAVFVPIGFMTGTSGKLFYEFAISVAVSVLISGFVSLSFAPMLCSKLLREKIHRVDPEKIIASQRTSLLRRFSSRFQQVFTNVYEQYQHSLEWSLNHPKTLALVSLLAILISVALVKFIPSDFLPTEDRGTVLTVIRGPEGTTMAYTDRAVRQAEVLFSKIPEVSKYFSVIALSSEGPGQVNQGLMFTSLKPWEERKTKQQEIVQQVFPKMMEIPEAMVFPMSLPSGPSRGFNGSIQVVLQGFDIQELNRYGEEIVKEARKIPGIINPDTDLKLNKPQIEVHILRERASELGVSPREISRALQILLGGLNVTDFKLQNKRYDVMLEADPQFRDVPQAIQAIMVKGRDNKMVPLASVISLKESVAPNQLSHYNRMRSVTISGSNLPFLTLGSALDQIEAIAKRVLPANIHLTYAGDSKEFREANTAFFWTFFFAILFIYLVLSAQFESFKHPLVILLTVPLATSGAIYTLFFANASMNVYSQIGIVLLIGLVTKNGILIVEYANQLRHEQGLPTHEAVFQAAVIRFRPILMTSVATIFGAIPIALALGVGSESRQTMGIAIVGGLAFSTLLTLYLVPAMYKLLNPDRLVANPTGMEERK